MRSLKTESKVQYVDLSVILYRQWVVVTFVPCGEPV